MLELVLRIGFSLLVVLGLLWVLAKVARRPLTGRGGGMLAVLARQQITRGSAVAVVRVVDRALIVGVTESQVTLLGETDLAALTHPAGEDEGRRETVPLDDAVQPGEPRPGHLTGSALSPQTWAQTVQFLRDRTARR
jgi:flagellar protein FliO/FliZ